MKNLLNPDNSQLRVLSLMYLIFGIILCVFSGSILNTAARVLGICLVLYGCFQLYLYFGKNYRGTSPLVYGIPALVLGALIAVWPSTLVNMFPIAIGIVLIFNSIFQFQKSAALKSLGSSSWIGMLVAAALMLGGGVFLIAYPGRTVSIFTKVCGAFLIVEAVILLWQSFAGEKR